MYRIFIASPGGLGDERQAFRTIVNAYNEAEAIPRGAMFIPVGWEATLGGIGRPQSIVNDELRECDYTMLVLHDRWGSAPSAESSDFSSGTEEEYSIALQCVTDPNAAMRDIVVCFKAVRPEQMSDPGPQLMKVLEFRRSLETNKLLLFANFDTVDAFSDLLRKHLAAWLRNHEQGRPKRVIELQVPVRPPTRTVGTDEAPKSDEQGSLLDEANRLASEGRATEAEAAYAKAIASESDPEAFLAFARFLARDGRSSQAEGLLLRIIEWPGATVLPATLARVHRTLGAIYEDAADYRRAENEYRQALALDRNLAETAGIAQDYLNIGSVLSVLGNRDEAAEMYVRAEDLFHALPDEKGVARSRRARAYLLATTGHADEAQTILEELVANYREAGDRQGLASALASLAFAIRQRSDLPLIDRKRSLELLSESLQISKALGDQRAIAGTLMNYGNALRGLGQRSAALAALEESRQLSLRAGWKQLIGKTALNLGIVFLMEGQLEKAEELFAESLEINEQAGRPLGVAIACDNLGKVAERRQNFFLARDLYARSRGLFRQMDNRRKSVQLSARIKRLNHRLHINAEHDNTRPGEISMNERKVVFVAFAIEDQSQRDLLKGQAVNTRTPFDFVDMSVKEPYDSNWKERVRTRIRRSDGVIALISTNTLSSSGEKWEIQCAKEEAKPIIGIWAYSNDRTRPYEMGGLPIIPWTWQGIADFIDRL